MVLPEDDGHGWKEAALSTEEKLSVHTASNSILWLSSYPHRCRSSKRAHNCI